MHPKTTLKLSFRKLVYLKKKKKAKPFSKATIRQLCSCHVFTTCDVCNKPLVPCVSRSNSESKLSVKMATQREKDAVDYLQKHRIMELLENLNSLMFFYRPGSDPHLHRKHQS